MEFILEEFVAWPSIDQFHRALRSKCVCVCVIADHFDVAVSTVMEAGDQEIVTLLCRL